MPAARRATDYRVDPFDLRLFTAVLELGTITAAAQAASLSLAAASARLKALENVVGTKLFERSKAGASVTDAGRALARHAHRVLAELEALHLQMAGFGPGLRGTIRLLCNTAAMAEALPARLGPFLARHPDIDLELQELSSDAVLEGLRRGVADIGIAADHVDTTGLDAQAWMDDRLVALLPARRPAGETALEGARTTPFAGLLEQPFVGLAADRGLSRFLLQQARRSGRVPHHRVRVDSFDAVAQIVASGVGVAVVPLNAARRQRNLTLRVAPLADPWAQRQLLLCRSPRAHDQPGIRALAAALLAR